MTAVPPDYDSDPGRRRSWKAPQNVHEMIAPELHGPILDVGCGEGRLASFLDPGVTWIGVDSSPSQLATNPYRPVVLADMRALPFRDGAFAEVAQLWCLYHLDDPSVAIGEAERVLQAGGRYYTSTGARDSDPEFMFEGYPASTFDAEEAVSMGAPCSSGSSRRDGTARSSHWRRATTCERIAVTVPSRPSGQRRSTYRSG
jgi:SAM-dependent methyltransferase